MGVLEPKPMFGLSELEFELIMWYFDIPLPPLVPWLYNANILSFNTSPHVCPVCNALLEGHFLVMDVLRY